MTLQAAPSDWLPSRTLLLKREDGHELGAFKWRGALPVVEEHLRRVLAPSIDLDGATVTIPDEVVLPVAETA